MKARSSELGLERGTKPHVHAVGHCQRCETVVEPMLSTQWFVKMEPLAKPAIEAVEQGKTKFVPETWSKTYFHWMRNIRDWCISRQLWWGHRIPAWYCGTCSEITVARTTPTACEHLRRHASPQAGRGRARHLVLVVAVAVRDAGLAERDARAARPSTRPRCSTPGYDILFFWVARMMMAGLHFMKKVPFRTVYLHTMVTDEKGEKMSKVKGNTIDPLDVIDKHGADALRFALAWLTTQAAQGKNIKFSMGNVEDARRFANKIWNATRFALMNLEGFDADRFADRVRRRSRPRGARRCPSAGSSRACSARPRRWTTRSRSTASPTPPRPSTTSSGTSSATGTSSSPRRRFARGEAPTRGALQDPGRAGHGARDRDAPAAPVHALHHRGDLAAAPQAVRAHRRAS